MDKKKHIWVLRDAPIQLPRFRASQRTNRTAPVFRPYNGSTSRGCHELMMFRTVALKCTHCIAEAPVLYIARIGLRCSATIVLLYTSEARYAFFFVHRGPSYAAE